MEDDTKRSLIEWVNSFPLSKQARGFSSLSGGQTIWEVLHDIDESYFAGDLPDYSDPSRKVWTSKWENLKYIHRVVATYLTEETEKDVPKGLSMVDLKLIAIEANAVETSKLLKLVLLAAISSPRSMEFIGRMPNLSVPTQNLLKEWIVEIGESPEDEPNSVDPQSNGASPVQVADQGFLYEERISRLVADKEKLKKEGDEMRLALEDLEERLEHSQAINSVLERKMAKFEERTREVKAAQDALGTNKVLESRIQEQEDVIARLEGEVTVLQEHRDHTQKTIDRLNASSGKSQKLQDAYDELKIERDELARKANTAEKYKQKLQAGGDMQKENLELRNKLEDLRQEYEIAKQAQQQVVGIQRAVDEYKRVLPKIEQERHELQMMKKQLEFDNATLAERWDKAKKQYHRDQSTIANLNDRLGIPNSTPTSPAAPQKEALGSELAEQSDSSRQLRTKAAELRDENTRLQSSLGESEAKIGMLEQMLDDVREQHEEREKKHLGIYRDLLILQSSLQAVQKGQGIKDTEIFENIQNRLAAAEESNTKLEQQLKRTQEELQESQNDLSLVDKDKIRQVEEIKRQQSSKLSDIQRENKALKRQTVDLEIDRAGMQALLRDRLNTTLNINDKNIREDIKELTEQWKAVTNRSANEDHEKNIDLLGKRLIETNATVAAREETIENQDLELRDLRASLQQLQSQLHHQQDPVTTAKTETSSDELLNPSGTSQTEYIANLERENRLMATAYHTLAGRLQMSNVTLQRSSETPNAWLNKQRRLVDQRVVMPST